MQTKLGWHFTNNTLRDGSTIPDVGKILRHKGAVIPCESGLHMSEEPFDALQFAPGAILHHVKLRGKMISHGNPIDKWVGRERIILQSINVTQLLRRFACDQALSIIHLCPNCPEVVLNYLKTADESLRGAARDAVWGAVWGAARDAVWAAAWDAAWDAARDAAWDAARIEFNSIIYQLFQEVEK